MKTMPQLLPMAVVLCCIFIACENAPQTQWPVQPVLSDSAVGTTLELDGVERIELFFYPDPDDRKNAQQLDVTDTILINTLKQNVQQETIAQAECPHDVKMFLVRNGEVFKTIYGATADSCNYLAYAINGKPYYTRLNKRSKALLDSLSNVAQ